MKYGKVRRSSIGTTRSHILGSHRSRAPIHITSTFLTDIKHNRMPAPEMSFTQPNLPALIQEINSLL
jgi:hypothetical protein